MEKLKETVNSLIFQKNHITPTPEKDKKKETDKADISLSLDGYAKNAVEPASIIITKDGYAKPVVDTSTTIITKEHVKAFSPLIKQEAESVGLPKEHKDIIDSFKTLDKHGITVEETENPESLKALLERVSPSSLEERVKQVAFTSFGREDNSYVGLNIGKDAESGKDVTLTLPMEKVKSLSNSLKDPDSVSNENSNAAEEIKGLKDLASKGAELYLEFPKGGGKEYDKVQVSPETFHWFMNNPSYSRKLSPQEVGIGIGYVAGTGVPFGAGVVAAGFYMHQYLGNSVEQKVIRGGFVDAVQDGKPNEPGIRANNWGEFQKAMKSLSRDIQRNEKKEKEAELGYLLFTNKPGKSEAHF